MLSPIATPEPPVLPVPPIEYSRTYEDQRTNITRLFFNRLIKTVRATVTQAQSPTLIKYTPTTAPANPEAGWVYYDSGTNKLRCYNGTIWNDLF